MAVFNVFYTIQDAKGQKSTTTLPIPATTTPANALAAVKAFGPLIGAITGGALVNAGVTLSVDVGTISGFGAAAADSDVQEKGFFSFRSVTNFIKSFNVPTILETVFSPGTKFIDQANTAIAALLTAVTDGVDVSGVGGTGTVSMVDSHGADLVTVEEARENWGKYRRG